ncbi:hypothetical protein [Planotetraspora sp. GP83]|uniref:hypothetical protein n=1 Tax=Planotetraspora sp. GP83 TaxID=3156264 RepID=UPI0035135C83
MAESEEIIRAVFEDWAVALNSTVEALTSQILTGRHGVQPDPVEPGNAERKLHKVIRHELTSMIHSYCVTINGGSVSAETGRVYLIDENGTDHTGLGLHGEFFGYLDSTGRSIT